jgi:hypothetical protein
MAGLRHYENAPIPAAGAPSEVSLTIEGADR